MRAKGRRDRWGPGAGVLVLILAAACAPGPGVAEAQDPIRLAAPHERRAGSLLDPVAEARIDSIFRDHDSTRSPGCAVGVVEGGALAFARGYGMASLEHGVPLGPASVFRIASVSKQFTAAVALLLERDGLISLDDEVRRHVPELPDYGEALTVRQLVHHTSGLRDYLSLMALAGRGADDVYTERDVVGVLARQEGLNFPPGERYLYSNSGYFLISELVRRVADRTLAEYAEENLFRPLGMVRTHFHDDHTRVVEGRAVGYAPREDGSHRVSMTRLNMVGDGGVFTSVAEMARWEALFQGTLGEDHPLAFLPERMLERGVLASGDTISYAFGLVHGELRGIPTVSHGGSFVGYRTHVLRFPEQAAAVVVFCNVASAVPGELARRVGEALLEGKMEPPAEEPDEEPEPEEEGEEEERYRPTPEALAAYAGPYRSDELQVTYRLRLRGDSLVLVEPHSVEGALEPREPGLFSRGGIRFRFERGEDGSVEELRVGTPRAFGIRFVPVEAGEPVERSDPLEPVRPRARPNGDGEHRPPVVRHRPWAVDPSPPGPETRARIDSVFRHIDHTNTPGCALGVEREGRLLLGRGYGMADLEQGTPIRPNTVFRVGSVSKQIAAAAIVLLAEEGKLSLDDELREHVPEVPDFGVPVTLRHVLHHTSGLRDWLTLRRLQGRPEEEFYTRADVLELVSRQRELNFEPGERFLYSNTGYLLLADVVERTTGRTLRELAAERLFGPLGMAGTRFHDDPDEVVARRAQGYAPDGGDAGFRIAESPLDVVGAGGLLTTVGDFLRWSRALADPGEIGPSLPERMLERGTLANGERISYALGLNHGELRGLRTVSHGGSWQGYRAHVLHFPDEDLSLAVFCNLATANPADRARRVAEVLLEDRMDPAPEEEDPDPTEGEEEPHEERWEPTREELAAYAGDYRSPELGVTYRIRLGEDGLALTHPEALEALFVPEEEDTFRAAGARLRFVRGPDGSVRELRVDAGRVLNLRFVPAPRP